MRPVFRTEAGFLGHRAQVPFAKGEREVWILGGAKVSHWCFGEEVVEQHWQQGSEDIV